MGRRIKTVVAAAVISLAVHTGLIYGPTISSWLNKTKISEEVMHEGIATSKSKPDVQKFRAEREKYVSELLETLDKGGRIRLSDFFIKSETLEQNIALAEKGESLLDERKIKRNYLELVESAKKAVDGKENELQALHEFLHNEHYAGYYWDSGSILDAIGSGWYNCASSTKLYAALMEDVIGRRDAKTIVFGDHLMTFVGGQTIENTANGWKGALGRYDGCGLIASQEIFVGSYILMNGVGPEELPRRLSHFYTSRRSWPEKCGGKAAKGPDGKSLLSYGLFPGVGINRGGNIPENFVPEEGDSVSPKKIVKMAELLLAVGKLEQSGGKSPQFFGEGQSVENFVPLPGKAEDYIELWERFRYHLRDVSERLETIPLRGRNCRRPIEWISQSTLLGVIYSLSAKGTPARKLYNRESLCQKFTENLDDPGRAGPNYYPLRTHCKEASDSLKKKCGGVDENGEPLCEELSYQALVDIESPENFDFFLNRITAKPKPAVGLALEGLIRSNYQEGCKILQGISPRSQAIRFALEVECGDNGIIWEELGDCSKGKGSMHGICPNFLLPYIKGNKLSRAQYEIIRKIGSQFPLYPNGKGEGDSADELEMPEIARILYEYGDKKTAEKYLKEYVSWYLTSPSPGIEICEAPKEFVPALLQLFEGSNYEWKQQAILRIATLIFSNGEQSKYAPQLASSLREIFFAGDSPTYFRVSAAMFLLKMGIDPIDPSQNTE